MGKTILVVEDDVNVLDVVRHNLARERYDVVTSRDGEAGIAAARARKPDRILLDIMPQPDLIPSVTGPGWRGEAEGIAKIAVMIGDEPPLKPLVDIPRMAEKTRDMFHRSLDAFVRRDAHACINISAEDDVVDGLYDQVYREFLTFMVEDPKTIT